MIEGFPKKAVASALALGLSAVALTGCGSSDKQSSWEFSVTCPPEADLQVVSTDANMYSPDSIVVTCAGEDGENAAPTSLELVNGPNGSTEVVNPNTANEEVQTLELTTTSNSGDWLIGSQEPRLSSASIDDASAEGRIQLSGVESIDRVEVVAAPAAS